jgi:protein ImuB
MTQQGQQEQQEEPQEVGERRYLALWFPFLPFDRLRIARPELWGGVAGGHHAPAIMVEKIRGAMRLSAADADALALGLAPGLTLADARAQVPDLRVFDDDPHADQDWLERLCDGCGRYTPIAALDWPHGLMLDIGGCAHLWGGEAGMADAVVERFSQRGILVRHARAGTPEAAHALARHAGASAPDETAAILRLPVAALRLEDEAEVALRRAGLRSIGDLASRPASVLAARFGAEAVTALERLLGTAARPLDPRRAVPSILVERRFAEPVGSTAYALKAMEGLVEEACVQLAERGQGGRRFAALFFRSDGLAFPLRAESSLPLRDPPSIMRLLHERIDSLSDPLDPGFGFDMLRLSVPAAEALAPSQLALEGGAAKREESVAALVDRLSIRAGRRRIQRLVPQGSHIPEQAQLALPAVETRTPAPWPTRDEPGDPPLRPIQLFDPPQPIDVLAEVPDGPPHRFRWRRALHEVTRFEGPERIAPEWWTAPDGALDGGAGHTRDYFRVEDVRGRRFWIYRDGLYGSEAVNPHWYLHGLFA